MSQDPALAPGTMVGEYRIEQLVGQGGMGQVYGAVHPLIGKRAAIKVLLPEICRERLEVERFMMEARSVNQIGHPNIVDVFAFGKLPDGRQYMVMEWLRGIALSDRIKHGMFTLADACHVLYGVAAALEAAHAAGITHRDLKPHNVFLVEVRGERPLVKLLDFGLVKFNNDEDSRRMERTRAGAVMGTPVYMSPQQAAGRETDERTDNYSLGVMAFEMLTGRLPFNEETAMLMMVAHMTKVPSPPSSMNPSLPRELDHLVYQLLAKNPGERPSIRDAMHVFGMFRDGPRATGTMPGHASPLSQMNALPPAMGTPMAAGMPMVSGGPVGAGALAVGTSVPMGMSTVGTSFGQVSTHAPAQSSKKAWLALVALVLAASAAVGVAFIVRGDVNGSSGGSGTSPAVGAQPAAIPDATAPETSLAVAPDAVPPSPPDASVAVVPDAPATTPDASVAATPTDPTVPRVKTTRNAKKHSTSAAPSGEDEDALMPVTRKKL